MEFTKSVTLDGQPSARIDEKLIVEHLIILHLRFSKEESMTFQSMFGD